MDPATFIMIATPAFKMIGEFIRVLDQVKKENGITDEQIADGFADMRTAVAKWDAATNTPTS